MGRTTNIHKYGKHDDVFALWNCMRVGLYCTVFEFSLLMSIIFIVDFVLCFTVVSMVPLRMWNSYLLFWVIYIVGLYHLRMMSLLSMLLRYVELCGSNVFLLTIHVMCPKHFFKPMTSIFFKWRIFHWFVVPYSIMNPHSKNNANRFSYFEVLGPEVLAHSVEFCWLFVLFTHVRFYWVEHHCPNSGDSICLKMFYFVLFWHFQANDLHFLQMIHFFIDLLFHIR